MIFIIICFICALALIISIAKEAYDDKKRMDDTFKKYEEFLKNKKKQV